MTKVDMMEYFDLVNAESVRLEPGILGFRKIFCKKEIQVRKDIPEDARCVVMGSEPGLLDRALRRRNVIGVMITDNELLRMTIEKTAENEKILFISTLGIVCADTQVRLRNIYRAKSLIASALRSKARISLVSMAEDEPSMFSSVQLLEMAKFLGATPAQASGMLSSLGGIE